MKKSLLALAVLGAFAGVASAQSSVTLFGIVDANVKHVKNGDNKMNKLDNNGLASSRLGFKGVEDLGGGLKAGFELQTAISPDTGNGGSGTRFWGRRSVVYLNGGFGEIRLGRDYVSSYWNINDFDPFGNNGVASALNVVGNVSTGVNTTAEALGSGVTAGGIIRQDNTLAYFLPSGLGGLYGQVSISAGEGVTAGRHESIRLGYAAGPLNVAASYGNNKKTNVSATGVDTFKIANIGASYDFGVAKVMGEYVDTKWDPRKQKAWMLGATAPLGQGELRASYWHADNSGPGVDAADFKQFGIGYVYNMSKRTALYGTYARISNNSGSAMVVSSGPAMSALGESSQGVEVGIKHSF